VSLVGIQIVRRLGIGCDFGPPPVGFQVRGADSAKAASKSIFIFLKIYFAFFPDTVRKVVTRFGFVFCKFRLGASIPHGQVCGVASEIVSE
jgi:hypothetical protein